MKNKRISFFDIAKGIGIILVVIGHLQYISEPFRIFIVSFHMPMFFLISGMLMALTKEEDKTASIYIGEKIKRIAFPYLIYSILFLILEIIYMYSTDKVNWLSIIQNMYYSVCLYGNSVLWFLPAMFFGCIMLYFLRNRTSHKVTIITVIVLTVIMYFLEKLNGMMGVKYCQSIIISELFFFFMMIIRAFFTLFYLTLGYYLYILLFNKLDIMTKIKPYALAAIGVVILIIVGLTSQLNGAVDFHFLMFGNPFLYLFNSIAGATAIVLICASFETVSEIKLLKLIRFYGKNSLTIMATHIDFYIMYGSLYLAMNLAKNLSKSRRAVYCLITVITVFAVETVLIICMECIKNCKNKWRKKV